MYGWTIFLEVFLRRGPKNEQKARKEDGICLYSFVFLSCGIYHKAYLFGNVKDEVEFDYVEQD